MHDFSTEYRLTDGSTTFSQEEWINDIKAQAWFEGACSVGESEFPSRDWDEGNPYRQADKVCGACSDDPNEAENACWGCAKAYRISVSNKTYDQIRKTLDDE